jgi:hypothetical protein
MSDAVYDPSAPGGTSTPESSGVARMFGILSIVFGSLVAVSDAADLLLANYMPRLPGGGTADQEALRRASQGVLQFMVAKSGAMLLMSVVLVVIGVGLYKQRESARKAAQAWALIGLAVLAGRAWLWQTKIWPRIEPATRAAFATAMSKAKSPIDADTLVRANHAAEFGVIALLAVYPILLLILLNLRSVRERTQA